jgi:hypothetical protein
VSTLAGLGPRRLSRNRPTNSISASPGSQLPAQTNHSNVAAGARHAASSAVPISLSPCVPIFMRCVEESYRSAQGGFQCNCQAPESADYEKLGTDIACWFHGFRVRA